ncbi:hypothetical protein HRbin19_00809 [bacterium HR19]|nr:hypothetical protein HRbin19_00809 [bacterium HR19]
MFWKEKMKLKETTFLNFLIIVMLLFFSCEKEKIKVENPLYDTEISRIIEKNSLPCSDEEGKNYTGGEFALIRNIKYHKNLYGDLYLPKGIKNFPVAIHIHGGGWSAGTRRLPMGQWWGELFACSGIALFDVEYTLYPKAKVKDQIKELKCAILWTQTEGKKFGIGDKVIVLGGSAGGHLTAMVSFTKDDFFPEECTYANYKREIKISAAIPFYGVYDLSQGYIKDLEVFRKENENLSETITSLSPINYVQNVDFPVLIIHGQADFLVPLNQSVNLWREISKRREDAEIFVVEDGAHGFDAFPQNEYTKKAKGKILEFLEKHNFLSGISEEKVPEHNHIEKGRYYLKEGFLKHAYLEFSKAGVKDCETEYGKLLAKTFDLLSLTINQAQSGMLNLLTPQQTLSFSISLRGNNFASRISDKQNSFEWKPNLNLLYENYIKPTEDILQEIQSLALFVYEKSCTFYEEDGIPIYTDAFTSEVRIGRKFGKEFALASLTISEIVKLLLNFSFSHDINFSLEGEKTSKYLIPFFLTEQDDIVGLIRLAGILYQENPNILEFKRPEKYEKVKGNLISSLSYAEKFIDSALLENCDSDVLCYKNGKVLTGKLSVNPPDFRNSFAIFLDLIEVGSSFLNRAYFSELKAFLSNIREKIKNNEYINLSEFNSAIPDIVKNFVGNIFPDFISINVGKFLDSKKPLREFLPEVVETDIIPDMKVLRDIEPSFEPAIALPSFLIEGELGKMSTIEDEIPNHENCYVCLPGVRFSKYDGKISIDGNKIEKLQDDCLSLDGKFIFEKFSTQKLPLIYVYFKNPSFDESLFIGKNPYGCGENEKISDFKPASNFTLNKSISYFITKLDSILRMLNF